MDRKRGLLHSKHMKTILQTVFAVFFIGVIIYEGRAELAAIKMEDVKTVLKSLPYYKVGLFTISGILFSCTSIIHDQIIAKRLSIKLSQMKIFRIGFISNTLNNALGGLSSAGTRTLLYIKEGIKPKEATYYNILIVSAFSTGLSILTLLSLLNLNSIRPIFAQYEFALLATIIIIFYAPLFFLINQFKWLKRKLLGEDSDKFVSYDLLFQLFLSSLLEWMTTAIFFCIIALNFSADASFIDVFSVFIIASVIGVVSLIPGALGAFDITLLLGMASINIDSHQAVASLLIFRLFYYVVPLLVALFLSLPLFLNKRKR